MERWNLAVRLRDRAGLNLYLKDTTMKTITLLLTALLLAACDGMPSSFLFDSLNDKPPEVERHARKISYFDETADCGSNRNPGSGEILIFNEFYYGGTCLRIPNGVHGLIPYLNSYGWDNCDPYGNGSCIKSIKVRRELDMFEEPGWNNYPDGYDCPGQLCQEWDDPRHYFRTSSNMDINNLFVYLEAVRSPWWWYAPPLISSLAY